MLFFPGKYSMRFVFQNFLTDGQYFTKYLSYVTQSLCYHIQQKSEIQPVKWDHSNAKKRKLGNTGYWETTGITILHELRNDSLLPWWGIFPELYMTYVIT